MYFIFLVTYLHVWSKSDLSGHCPLIGCYFEPCRWCMKCYMKSQMKHRLWVVPHFSSGIVEWGKHERTWKSPHAKKGDMRWGERKMRDYRQSPSFWPFTAAWFWSVKFVFPSKSIILLSTSNEIPSLIFLSPHCMSPFLAWGDFHVRSRFAHSTIPEEKWGTTCSLNKAPYVKLLPTKPCQFLWSHHLMISSIDSKVVEPFHKTP